MRGGGGVERKDGGEKREGGGGERSKKAGGGICERSEHYRALFHIEFVEYLKVWKVYTRNIRMKLFVDCSIRSSCEMLSSPLTPLHPIPEMTQLHADKQGRRRARLLYRLVPCPVHHKLVCKIIL